MLFDFFKLFIVALSAFSQFRLNFSTSTIQIIVKFVLPCDPMLHRVFLDKYDVCKFLIHNLDCFGFLLVVAVVDVSGDLLQKEISLFSYFFFANFQNKQSSI